MLDKIYTLKDLEIDSKTDDLIGIIKRLGFDKEEFTSNEILSYMIDECYLMTAYQIINRLEITDIVLAYGITNLIGHSISGDSVKSVMLPDTIEFIHDSAFYFCENLVEVWIPSYVEYMAPDTFWQCPNVVVHCYKHSYAHLYCRVYDIKHKLVNDS